MLQQVAIILLSLRVAFVGDPQVDNPKELAFARSSVYSELRARKDLDLVVVLGDLVNENPALIAPSEASLDSLRCPWVRVNGNHDGPSPVADSSFIVSGIRFILMNNVRRTSKGYEGGFSERQKRWLDSLLTARGPERTVLCTHIPLSRSKGIDSLSLLLSKGSKLLLVCGHTHSVMRHYLSSGTEEIVAGASCGSWWRGVKGDDGIPYALMNCGAPRGFFLADFSASSKSGWYRLDYKAVHRDDRFSVRKSGEEIVVNVYGGSMDGQVSLRCRGREVVLHREERPAPEVLDVIDLNASRPREYRKEHREEFIPMRRLPSPHVWACPSSGLPEKTGRVKVIYSDPSMSFGKKYSLVR